MDAQDRARKQRAAARAERMVIRKGRLAAEEVDLEPTSGAAAVSLVMRLSIESFSLAGQTPRPYARREIPIRFVDRRS